MEKTRGRLLSAVVSAAVILAALPGYGAAAVGGTGQMTDGGAVSYAEQIDVWEQQTVARSDERLGSDSACTGYAYGSFSGVPACVDQRGNLHICEQNFPDPAFREYVRTEFDWEGDGLLTADESEISGIGVDWYNITSLSGVEFFCGLKELSCSYNQLTELDLSNNTELTTLWCGSNQLTELNISNHPLLTYVECWGNQLTELDIRKSVNLETLMCSSNQLSSLDVSKNTNLIYLDCSDNQLKKLDIGSNTKLNKLYCDSNNLEELDVSCNQELDYLFCPDNQIVNLDVSNNPELTYLVCGDNQLKKLDVNNNNLLVSLQCENNQLTELDVSNNPELVQLWCDWNNLLTLDLSNNSKLEDFRGDSVCYDFFTVTEYQDGHWVFDFSKYFTTEQLARITVDFENDPGYIQSYDPETGRLTFTGFPGVIDYTYNTGNPNVPEMRVSMDFTIVCNHPDGAGEWIDGEPATCTRPGTQVQCCIRCGEILNSREIPAAGHSWGEWIIERPATEETEGLQYRICQTCGEREEQIIPVVERAPGDVTGDGEITATDARLALQAVTGSSLTPEQQAAADLNGDGKVTAADARMILQLITA